MDNQDLTLERRLQGKDETIADLLEALERLVCVVDQAAFIDTGGVVHKATKAIRKAKENER